MEKVITEGNSEFLFGLSDFWIHLWSATLHRVLLRIVLKKLSVKVNKL